MRIFQVLDALDFGDAVSTHSIEIREMLSELGYETDIYSLYVHDLVQHLRQPFDELRVRPDDVVIYHFSGKSSLVEKVRKLNCKKMLIYHNITPHHFFEGMEPHYQHCLEGRKQLNELVGWFDLYVGDSEFNVQELCELGCNPARVMPIVVDLSIKGVRRLYKGKSAARKFLFVGRVAPNKKHEDIIRVFDYYCTYIDPQASLYLVGNYQHYMPYYEKLMALVMSVPSRDRIIFTGKVTDEELEHHYRSADVFLAMSEHEGFCVPLLESMSYGLPTFAFDSGAVESTMGGAGVLLLEKRYDDIGELINLLLQDEAVVQKIIDHQYEWLTHFSKEEARRLLGEIVLQVGNL